MSAVIARSDEHPDYWAVDLVASCDAETVEKWFGDYPLTDRSNAQELHAAFVANAASKNPCKVALQYVADMKSGMCRNIDDFFGYYLPDRKCAAELDRIIDAYTTPRAYESLSDFCLVKANAEELERELSIGEP